MEKYTKEELKAFRGKLVKAQKFESDFVHAFLRCRGSHMTRALASIGCIGQAQKIVAFLQTRSMGERRILVKAVFDNSIADIDRRIAAL